MDDLWHRITDTRRWPKSLRRVSISLRRIRRREVLTFLLFVAIAGFFWTVQTSREESVQDFVVQLVINHQPQDVVFTTHIPRELRVAITDNNSRLFNYGYNHRLSSIEVDFERYADAVGNFRLSAAELQSLLSDQLLNTTRVVSVSPSLIDARFAQTEGRSYPVRLKSHYTPADNYRMRNIIIEPDSVIINAPSSVLDTLQYVYAADHNHWNLTDSLDTQLPLDLPIGVKATPASVRVIVPVVQYVQKVFPQVVVSTTDVPEGQRLVVFPYAVQLSCLVDFDSYQSITADMFEVSVSYDSIPQHPADPAHHYLPIHVAYQGPEQEAVSHISLSSQYAEYVIE